MSIPIKPFVPLRESLLLLLGPLGFAKSGRPLQLSRVREDILQTVSIVTRKEGIWETTFQIAYASSALFTRPGHVFLAPGATLGAPQFGNAPVAATVCYGPSNRWQATDAWMVPAVKPEPELARIFDAIGQYVAQEVKPWLEQTGTVTGLLGVFEQDEIISKDHRLFDRACCLARLARCDEARGFLAQAKEQFAALASKVAWCAEYVAMCDDLDQALARGQPETVLQQWTEWSREKLNKEMPSIQRARRSKAAPE